MGKFKNIWKRSEDGENSQVRSFVRLVIVMTVFFFAFLFVKRDNVIEWAKAGFTISAQNRRMEVLQKENDELDLRTRQLTTNRDTLEKFARETYGFTEKGDKVFICEP